jgi:D-aminopeptidase
MEGASQLRGVREIWGCLPEYWETGRPRLEADVRAVCEGLLAGGALELVVLDNHGGNTVNVSPEALPPGARLATWRDFDPQSHAVDATFQVGYHPRGGVEGFLSHTYLRGLRLRMDEELISETHGRVGVGSPASRHRGQRSPPANDRFSLGDALSRCAEVSRPQCGAATLER